MDVCIEALNFEHINAISHSAKDTFVSLRVDGVQKQSQYSATQEWTFPGSAAQKHGRMEVFRCLAKQEIDLNALAEKGSEEDFLFSVGSTSLCLKLSAVLPPSAEPDITTSPRKWRELEATRMQYLETHDVKGLVGKSVCDMVGVPAESAVASERPTPVHQAAQQKKASVPQGAVTPSGTHTPSGVGKSKQVFHFRMECPAVAEEQLSGLFFCIALNGAQKQARLAPTRTWRLPARASKKGALGKNIGEVKLLQRSGDVLVDLTSASQEVSVPLPDANAMTFSMHIKGGEPFAPPSKPLWQSWQGKDVGFELLQARDMRGLLHSAFKSVLRDQPHSPEDMLFSKFFSKKLPPLSKRPSRMTAADSVVRPMPYMARSRSNSSVRLAPLPKEPPRVAQDKPQVDSKVAAALEKKVENSKKATEEAVKSKREAEAKVHEKEAEMEAMAKQVEEKQRAMRALAAVRSQLNQDLKKNAEAEKARLQAELDAVAAQKATQESAAEDEQKNLQVQLEKMAAELDEQAKRADVEKARLEAELEQSQQNLRERDAATDEARFQKELEFRLKEELQKRVEEQEAAANEAAADHLCQELEKLEAREEAMAKQAEEEQARFRAEMEQAAKEAAARARQVAEEQLQRLQDELEQALQRQDAEEHQRLEEELQQARQEQSVRARVAEEENQKRMEHELEQLAKQQEEEMARKSEEERERLRAEFEQAAQEQEARSKQQEEEQQERFRMEFEQRLREQAVVAKQAAEEERHRLQMELESASRQQEVMARQAELEMEKMRQEAAKAAQEREAQTKRAAEEELRLRSELEAAKQYVEDDGEEHSLPEADYLKAQAELHELEARLSDLDTELQSTKDAADTAEQKRQEAESREREVQAEVQTMTQRYQESEAQKQRALEALATAEAAREEAVKQEAAAKEAAEDRLRQELERVAQEQEVMAEKAAEEQRRMRAELEQAAQQHAASARKVEEETRQRLQKELEQATQQQEELARKAVEEQQRLREALEKAREEKDEFGVDSDEQQQQQQQQQQRLHEELQAATKQQEALAQRAAEEQKRLLEELQRNIQEQAARAKQAEEETQERIRLQIEEMAKQQQEEMSRKTEEERQRLRAEFEHAAHEQAAKARQEEEEQKERLKQELDRVTQQQAEMARLVEEEQHQLEEELERANQETLAMAEQADEEQQRRLREEMEVARQQQQTAKKASHPLASRPAADTLISMPASSVGEDMAAAAARRRAESDAKDQMRLEAKAAEYKAQAFDLPPPDGSSVHEQAQQMAAQFAEERTWLHALEMMHRYVVDKANKEAMEVETQRFTLGWQPGDSAREPPLPVGEDDEFNRRAEVSWMVAEDFAGLREEQALRRNNAIKAIEEVMLKPEGERQGLEARMRRQILKADDMVLRYQEAERKARKKAVKFDQQRDERLLQLDQQKMQMLGSAGSSAMASTSGMAASQQAKKLPRTLATEAWEELIEATNLIEASSMPEQTLRLCIIRQLEYELDEMCLMAEEAKAAGDPSAEQWESTAKQLEMTLAEVREEQQAAERQTRVEVFSADDADWLARSVGQRVDLD